MFKVQTFFWVGPADDSLELHTYLLQRSSLHASWAQGPEFESRWGDVGLNQGLSTGQMRRQGLVKPHQRGFFPSFPQYK